MYYIKLLIKDKLSLFSMIIIILYFIDYILDIIYPEYLGVKNINNVLVFKIKNDLIPVAPSISSWNLYMGTTYYGIKIFPAVLASLKIDFTILLSSLALSVITGFFLGYTSIISRSKIYKMSILYINKVFFDIPYLIIALLILFVLRPSIYGIIIAIYIAWFPFYINRSYKTGNKKIKDAFTGIIPYIISDMGSIFGIITIITFFGFYYSNPYIVDLGNIMNINGNFSQYISFGDWWILIFPLIFMVIFILFTSILSYKIKVVLNVKK